jgi:ATP-dependent DNA helicase RecQ
VSADLDRTLVRVHDLLPDLQRLFGFAGFRPGQERVVRAALAGRDTLALMPTGSGKSLTYQLAAMLRERPTLVLSPLIALMKDQVDKLPPEIAAVSTFVNSSLPPEETAARVAGLAEGRYRLLYAAPERLRQYEFVEALRAADVGFVVVDEVHCVSMWGHDFRPDYLFIRRALDALGSPPLLGMTATASPATEREIAAALGRDFDVVRTTVVRPNLRYDVERAETEEERLRSLLGRLRALKGASAIVYARSRRSCERLARLLRQHGFAALHYHAGLESEERTAAQEAFLGGRARVVVATTAFGMGIDKPDIRLVVLYNLPESLESYVQMVGRAGRDGEPSDTVLFVGRADTRALERFALSDVPSREELASVFRLVRERPVVEPDELAAVVPEGRDPRVLVGMLEQAELVRRGYDQGRALHVQVPPPPADAGVRIDELLRRSEVAARERARRLIAFAESARCRHAQVAEHFGESLDANCGTCDVCAPRAPAQAGAVDSSGLPAPPLPADVGAAIVAAVSELEWPLGRTGLAAMLLGSVSAPPSARRSRHFGVLRAATQADVRRWIKLLEVAGCLELFETEDGFRLLRAVPGVASPRIATADTPADDGLFERLRAWRRQRAQSDEVPAYVVLHDRTLRELAAAKPRSRADLASVNGFGPAKLERYADDVLAVLAAPTG